MPAKTRRGSRSSRGIFSSILSPASALVRGVGDVATYTLSKGYRTVRHVADGAERTVRGAAKNVTSGAAGIVDRSGRALNRTVRSVTGKAKKSRRNRKNSRKSNRKH